MAKHSAILAFLALTGCGLKSDAADEAVMGANFDCVPLATQQAALASVQGSIPGNGIKIRCDDYDCATAFAEAAAFGGKITLVAIPGSLAVSWFNNSQLPTEQQQAQFKDAVQSVSGCKLVHRHGW